MNLLPENAGPDGDEAIEWVAPSPPAFDLAAYIEHARLNTMPALLAMHAQHCPLCAKSRRPAASEGG